MALQEYTPTQWEDAPNSETPITADKLNNIEGGISRATGAIQDLEEATLTMQDVENKVYEIVDGIFSGNMLTIEPIDGEYWLTYTTSDSFININKIANVSTIIHNEVDNNFVKAETVTSLSDATEAGKLYLYGTDYYFNVVGSIWTQYKIALGEIYYRERIKVNNVWGEWSNFIAFETTDARVSAITDGNKTSTTKYPNIKAVVDYITAQ